ncbi:phage holin family protein [Paenibacillus chibensis]|uniref:Phage holin family protein n=1 Tax=Paenibacillus chibensis TaxID=59846 RepID=A0ABU6PV30_9BACL|nr:phage holin family protein [Paenibacillus chibensis]
MDKTKMIFSILGAIFVPVFDFLYGQSDSVVGIMTALLFFIILDWLSGVRAAKKDNTYASRYGLDGVARTFFILLLPAGGHFLDVIFGLPGIIFGALAIGALYHIVQSMTANAIRAGWGDWLPIPVLNAVIDWVKSELEKKIKRAESRREEVK